MEQESGLLKIYACSVTVEDEEDNYEEDREERYEELVQEEGDGEEVPPPPYTTSPTTRVVESRHVPSHTHAATSRYFSSSRRSVLNKPHSIDRNESKSTDGKTPESMNNRIRVLPLKYDIDTDDTKPSQQLWFTQTPTGWVSGTSPTKIPPPEPVRCSFSSFVYKDSLSPPHTPTTLISHPSWCAIPSI